jgi:hypothetical protein
VRVTNHPREASEPQAQHLRDSLVATKCRHLSQHAIAVRLGLAGQVLRKSPCLAESVLASRRVVLAGCRSFGTRAPFPQRPDVVPTVHSLSIDHDPASFVDGDTEFRVWTHHP